MVKEKIEVFLKENKDKYHWNYNFYPESDCSCFSVIIEEYVTFIISIFAEDELTLIWNDGNIIAKEADNWEELKETLLRYLNVGSVVEW